VSWRGAWSRWAEAWIALWDRREPATALAAVRIAVALVLLYDYAVVWQLDLIEPLWARPPDGYAIGGDGRWAARWLGTGAGSAFTLWAISMIALVAVATGTLTRVACVVVVLVSAHLAHRAPDTDRGIDGLLRVVLLVLALSRSHAVWSVDALVRRRIGRPMPAEIPAWPRYLLFAQLIWVYFSGGHNKTGEEWGPLGGFTALANALSDPHFARFDPGWLGPIYPLTRVATAATMLFELGAPLMLLFTYYAATPDRPGRLRRWCNRLRLRWLWIGLGVSFHLGIALTMRLGIFPAGMLALYPVLLLPGELEGLRDRLRDRLRGRRARGRA
jgi:hypothetical protein